MLEACHPYGDHGYVKLQKKKLSVVDYGGAIHKTFKQAQSRKAFHLVAVKIVIIELKWNAQAMEDQYMEDITQGARFDDTDDEEKDENNDNLVLADYEGDDLPTIEWNREDPQLAEGTVFQTMMDYRNAITTYCILTNNDYEVIKSDPDKEELDRPYLSTSSGSARGEIKASED
ncbi:hypothetical protein QYE76_008432 [Lolium multiflorum]|uniref:Uncharacterized protein n=1 Tax=Lolium multiflorum TaxID=4521 RepID=A0AAD8TQ49_LOLMU|nr:hypothetical protein QYE76_008432 [Lolium multiflorum]